MAHASRRTLPRVRELKPRSVGRAREEEGSRTLPRVRELKPRHPAPRAKPQSSHPSQGA